jgi:hypothetical protein
LAVLGVTARKDLSALKDRTHLDHAHPVFIATKTILIKRQAYVLLATTVMEVLFIRILSIKLTVIVVLKGITAQQAVPTHFHVRLEPTQTKNTTNLKTIAYLVFPECTVLNMD